MSWAYKFETGALRQLENLGPSACREIVGYLDKRVAGTPDPRKFGKPLRGSKHGLWRYRVRDWRLICRLEDGVLIVVVIAVGPRATIYDE